MKNNLHVILSFDVVDSEGKSMLNGQHNAIKTAMKVAEVNDSDITALHLWLRHIVCGLLTPELTGHLMPAYQELADNTGNTDDKQPQPHLTYQDLSTQIVVRQDTR